MADVNSTLIDVCNEIALALQVKLNSNNKFKPINYAARVLDIGSEANAVASDVKLGKKVYVGDDYVDGTFEGVDLNVSLSAAEQMFEPETGKYYKKVIVPAASAPADVWDGTGIIIEPLLKLATPAIELVEPEVDTFSYQIASWSGAGSVILTLNDGLGDESSTTYTDKMSSAITKEIGIGATMVVRWTTAASNVNFTVTINGIATNYTDSSGQTSIILTADDVVTFSFAAEAPQIEFTLNGTTYACPDGITWGEYANLDSTEYPASSNADVRWLDSASDGTGMQFNDDGTWRFILYNGEYVDNTDAIIGRAVYTIEEPPEDELAGAWKLNSRIENNSTQASFNVSGRFNARKDASISPMISTSLGFIGLSTEEYMLTLGIKDATTAPLNQCNAASYKGLAADGKSYSGTGVTRGSVYSTFEIYSTLEEVTNGQILLAWLKANATKLSAASLITFIIAGASYQAEEGMTWGEWVESEYNTYTYTLSGSKVVNGRGDWVQLNGQSCFGTDFIIDSATYVCVAASGSN